MNTPLRDEIGKICEQHFPIATVKAELEADIPKSKLMETIINHEVNKVINRVVDEILNLIASKMPEKKDYSPAQTLADHWGLSEGSVERTLDNMKAAGWNEAIDSVKSILKGGTE